MPTKLTKERLEEIKRETSKVTSNKPWDELLAHAEATVDQPCGLPEIQFVERSGPSRAEIAIDIFMECQKRTLDKITSQTTEAEIKKAVGNTVRFSVHSTDALLAELAKK